MLCGELRESSGTIRMNNRNFKDLIKDGQVKIGICPGYEYLFENLTVRTHLRIAAMIK